MTASKIVAAAASGVSTDPGLDIDDIFSTQVYDGDNKGKVINNQLALGSTFQFDYTFDGSQTSPTTITPNLGSTSTWEVSFFFKCTNTSIGNQWLITTNQGYSNSSPPGFLIGLYNLPGYLSIAVAGTNFGAYGFTGDYPIVQDNTYHCVVNYNGSGTLKVFIDGRAIAASNGSLSIGSGSVTWNSVDLGIGRGNSTDSYNSSKFTGSLHGVTVTTNLTRTGNFVAPTMSSSGATVDVAGSGGLVWTKSRSHGHNHNLVDTEQGVGKYLSSNSTAGIRTDSYAQETIIDFFGDGYKLGADTGSDTVNRNGRTYVSWSFRKAPKFFDIQTWTGNGASDRAISHNLESVPGMIIVKRLNTSEDWGVWHREFHNNTTSVLYLNQTNALTTSTHIFGATNPTSTAFYVGDHPVSNSNGDTYIAYIFAHNNNDGKFGENADQDVIKCGSTGSYTSGTPLAVNIGFEPQWVLIKSTSGADGWYITDVTREMLVDEGAYLQPNNSSAEGNFDNHGIAAPTPTGFTLDPGSSALLASGTYMYMAIRRGSLNVPTDATKVFNVGLKSNNDTYSVGFPTDLALVAKTGGSSSNTVVGSRLTGNNKFLVTSGTDVEATSSNIFRFDLQNSFKQGFSTSAQNINWLWKRAPGYFDVVTYTGDNSQHNENHNLGVVPEMIWTKARNGTYKWGVYHKDIGVGAADGLNGTGLNLNNSDGLNAGEDSPLYQHPTATQFQPRGTQNQTKNYIAYLFATVAGVSKVGSYTGNGSSSGPTVDCGFSSGARFVLIKRTAAAGSWGVWDSDRGIVAGNDPYLFFNATAAQTTNLDILDPHTSGFTISSHEDFVNANGETFIFYAIA